MRKVILGLVVSGLYGVERQGYGTTMAPCLTTAKARLITTTTGLRTATRTTSGTFLRRETMLKVVRV